MTVMPRATEFDLPAAAFDGAVEQVNLWRGRCLAQIARAEQAVTTCYGAILEHGVETRAKKVYLVGQRYAALEMVLTGNSWSGRNSDKALQALRGMAPYHQLRVLLCHGTADVSIDRRGRWVTIWRMAKIDTETIINDVEIVTQQDAERLALALKKASDRLCSLLNNVRSELETRESGGPSFKTP